MLNRALFARHGVEVVGAIINKVNAEEHPTLPDVLREGLAHHGIELLGLLPYRPLLSNPTLAMLVEQIKGELLSESDDLDRVIQHVAIGAMQPRHLIERVGPGSLLIVPGDRTDVIHAVVAANRAARVRGERRRVFARRQQLFGRAVDEGGSTELAGLVLTGGYRPRPRDLEAIRGERLFAMLVGARHLRGGLSRPRPAGQDPSGRPREDRADSEARSASTSTSTTSFRASQILATSLRVSVGKLDPLPVRTIRSLSTRIPRLPGMR